MLLHDSEQWSSDLSIESTTIYPTIVSGISMTMGSIISLGDIFEC